MIWVRRIIVVLVIGVVIVFCLVLPVAFSYLITNSRFRRSTR